MQSLLLFFDQILALYHFTVIAYFIISLLVTFQILNPRQPLVFTIASVVNQLVNPVLRYIQRFIPRIGVVDLSPLILLLLIGFVRNLLREYFFGVALL